MSDFLVNKLKEMSASELISFIHSNTNFVGLDDIFSCLDGETLFGIIEDNTDCAKFIADALEEEYEADAYADEFEKKWRGYIDAFAEMSKELKHINVFLWMTDCDSQEELWADWFMKEGYDVCDTFLCADWFLKDETKYSIEAEDIISAIMQLPPYDNQGKKDCYWRNDCIETNEIYGLIDLFKKLDKVLDTYFQL